MLKKLNIKFTDVMIAAATIGLALFCVEALAATSTSTTQTIGQRATAITSGLKGIIGLLKAVAYIGGFGLCMAGILKFKAHKDNPQQVPLSQPIVLIGVGAALVALGGSVDTLTQTLVGTTTTYSASTKDY